MKWRTRGTSGSGERNRSVFNVNIVPIVDALTILITFMLASGVYISIAVLDVGVSGSGEASANRRAETSVAVLLEPDRSIQVDIRGNEMQTSTILSDSGSWNFKELGRTLASLRESHQKVRSVTLVAHPSIDYQDVVGAMEMARKTHPEVLLGGF